MSTWTEIDLRAIGENDDLYVSPLREDGTTYGTPTRIWSVLVEVDIYVRPASGTASRWYAAAIAQQAGAIRVGDVERDVAFDQKR
jgi:hypothetical protein